jgi:DNA polymerase I
MVDLGYLEEESPKLGAELDKIHKKINRIAGKEINLKSTPQLRELLFGKLGLEPIKMTSGGDSGNRQPSTDESCLQVWAEQGIEVAVLMLKYRELQKILGTYVDGLRKWVDRDLRIHPTLTQHVTVTGRLSSVDPNLQNIPRAENDPIGLRTAFIPKDGHIFLVADYAQLEMRLLAHFSQDKNMIDVINRGWDIHMGTASLMYGYTYEEIKAANKKKKSGDPMTDEEKHMVFARQAAKSIGFGQHTGRRETHSKRGNLRASA